METQISVKDKKIDRIKDKKIDKTAILLIATLASFLTPFMGTSLNVALPTISSELAVNAILLSWITTAFFFNISNVCSSFW